MQQFQDFSSWQPEQERQFVVFEQRTVEASKRAWAIGLVAGVAFGIAVICVAVAFKPTESRSEAAASENPDLSSERISGGATTAAPTPVAPAAPAAAPAATPTDPAAGAPSDPAAAQPSGAAAPTSPSTDPAAAPAGGAAPTDRAAPAGAAQPAGESSGGAAMTPPPPPPGATKAPPTALVKDKNK